MPSLRTIAPAVVAALALGACAENAGFYSAECARPEARLAALGVPADDIAGINIATERATEGGVISRHAWVRLNSCRGYIVVRLDSSCDERGSDAYATGDCRLPQRRAS